MKKQKQEEEIVSYKNSTRSEIHQALSHQKQVQHLLKKKKKNQTVMFHHIKARECL